MEALCKEIHGRKHLVPQKKVTSLYFGGGTPSLLSPAQLEKILKNLNQAGFSCREDIEITIEINPGTLTKNEVKDIVGLGVNRFSLGVQSFNDQFLQACGRRHSADETRETLSHLKSLGVIVSMDFLFLLPGQNLENLHTDCKEFFHWDPEHISPYGLDVPNHHPLFKQQPLEPIQERMYQQLWEDLTAKGYEHYEISNFCRDKNYSRHNLVYWSDQPYWGLGLGAHSYFKETGEDSPWGLRFSNPRSQKAYFKSLARPTLPVRSWSDQVENQRLEILSLENSLTDFCFTSLRTQKGLDIRAVRKKFGDPVSASLSKCLDGLQAQWIHEKNGVYRLSEKGKLVSNRVFEKLTFFTGDFSKGDIDLTSKEPIL